MESDGEEQEKWEVKRSTQHASRTQGVRFAADTETQGGF